MLMIILFWAISRRGSDLPFPFWRLCWNKSRREFETRSKSSRSQARKGVFSVMFALTPTDTFSTQNVMAAKTPRVQENFCCAQDVSLIAPIIAMAAAKRKFSFPFREGKTSHRKLKNNRTFWDQRRLCHKTNGIYLGLGKCHRRGLSGGLLFERGLKTLQRDWECTRRNFNEHGEVMQNPKDSFLCPFQSVGTTPTFERLSRDLRFARQRE